MSSRGTHLRQSAILAVHEMGFEKAYISKNISCFLIQIDK